MTPRALILLLIAGATLFAATNVGVGWLYALGFLFIAYVAGAFALAALSLRGLEPVLRTAPRAEVGGSLRVDVTLTPRSTRRLLSLVARPLGDRPPRWRMRGNLIPEGWGHALLLEARGGEGSHVSIEVPTPARGTYPGVQVVLQAPALGLGAVHRTLHGDGEILVWPQVTPLPSLGWLSTFQEPDPLGDPLGVSAGHELVRSVRAYQPGDALRQIHWRSSARTGELRVKETEGDAPRRGGLAIALDLGPGHTPESREQAIHVAASLCAYAQREGLAAQLFSQAGAAPTGDLEAQLDWLARLPAVPGPTLAVPPRGEARTIVVTAAKAAIPGTWRLWVGERAPDGAIACPPGCDLAEVLGRDHGAA